MKSQALSLAAAMRLKRLARGRLACTNMSKSGVPFYCLQYTKDGRHVTQYIPAAQVAAYREATENYRAFMDAVNAHVDELTEKTAQAIRKEAERCRQKAKASKSARRSSRRGS